MNTPLGQLASLLEERFLPGEFDSFLRMHSATERVPAQVRSPDSAPAVYFAEAAQVMLRRNLADRAFFDRLQAMDPMRHAEIEEVARSIEARDQGTRTPSDAGAIQASTPTRRERPAELPRYPRDLIEVLSEHYPDVGDARLLWERAGGRRADVEHVPRARDLWQRLWRRSVDGAAVTPAALLREVQVDLPGNPVIARYLQLLDPTLPTP